METKYGEHGMKVPTPANDNIDPNAPLRLAVAAEHAFPFGGMTASGLRKKRDRGRLTTWMIAGKEYTTINSIEEMKQLCRVEAEDHTSGCEKSDGRKASSSLVRTGSSSRTGSISPRDAMLARLAKRKAA
jgi:hypothetical protein